jgi:hypothetical protein
VRPSRDPDGVVNSLGAFGTVYEGISHIGAGGSERSPVGLTTDGLHSMPNEGCARALSGWVNWLVPILARAVGGPQSGRYMDAWLAWAPLMRAARADAESDLAGFTVAIQRTGSEAAQARMSELENDMQPLAEEIIAAPATSLSGLRAKALVALWEALPSHAFHHGAF